MGRRRAQITAVTNAVMYMIPIIVGMSVMPDILDWEDGSFVDQVRADSLCPTMRAMSRVAHSHARAHPLLLQADSVLPWMGIVVVVSAVMSNVGIFQVRRVHVISAPSPPVSSTHINTHSEKLKHTHALLCSQASVSATSRAMWAMGGGAAEVAVRARTFELI